jgi:lysophospholipase L1-like esterase
MRSRLSADVLAYKPDVLFVMGGTNDLAAGVSQATIIANLRAIVTTAQSHGIHVFLLTIPPDSYPAMVSRVNSLNGAIVSLGTSLKVRVTNIHRPLASSAGTYIARYTSDGLHLSSLGAQVVANTIYARIKPVGY